MNSEVSQRSKSPEPLILRLFISYASEDRELAVTMATALQTVLGEFAEINIDKWFLQAGEEFKQQIEAALERTNILIILYTGVSKVSHGYTGWEVGYFEHSMKGSKTEKRIVAFYLQEPPATETARQGIGFGITKERLRLTPEEFDNQNIVEQDDRIVDFVANLLDSTDGMRKASGFAKRRETDENNPALFAQKIRSKLFRVLRTKVDSSIKPQKQLIFRTTGSAFARSAPDLPSDAMLVPVGSASPMSTFGLPDTQITWGDFIEKTREHRYSDTWRYAIASVIDSSFPDKLDVDNSKIILSAVDNKSYRIILSSSTRHFDDSREFGIYFVETLPNNYFGDNETTLLLKGLGVVCRFRFMFLEPSSEFASHNIEAMSGANLRDEVFRMIQELDLLQRDSRSANLHQPNLWNNFIDGEQVVKMFRGYEPLDLALREVAKQILISRAYSKDLHKRLVQSVKNIEVSTRHFNESLIKEMCEKLVDSAVR